MNDKDIQELAAIIDDMAAEGADAWNFTRGTVDSVSIENAADVIVEGHTTVTRNVPALITYNPRVGDKVLILRSGPGGANMVLFGVIPDGTYRVNHWYSVPKTSPWVDYGAQFVTPQMTIDSHARVRLRGSLKDNAPDPSHNQIALLPAKFRPRDFVRHVAVGKSDGFIQHLVVEIFQSGVVTALNPQGSQGIPPVEWVALDGISYKAA